MNKIIRITLFEFENLVEKKESVMKPTLSMATRGWGWGRRGEEEEKGAKGVGSFVRKEASPPAEGES